MKVNAAWDGVFRADEVARTELLNSIEEFVANNPKKAEAQERFAARILGIMKNVASAETNLKLAYANVDTNPVLY